MSAAPDFLTQLTDPRFFRIELERMHEKFTAKGKLYEPCDGKIAFATLSNSKRKVAKLLAGSIRAREYTAGDATLKSVRIGEKTRELWEFGLVDRIVHGSTARVITDILEPRLSPNLYSYRRGITWLDAPKYLAAFIRKHNDKFPKTGLYVLHQDIQSYTDSIPVGEDSPLWEKLDRLLGWTEKTDPYAREILKGVIRPALIGYDGIKSTRVTGIPTGSPITALLYNLYAQELDEYLDHIPGGFYARYSDDYIFVHPDANVVQEAEIKIAEILYALKLRVNPSKTRRYFLNAAGRASHDWSEARGITRVHFLGCGITAQGTVMLSTQRARRLVRDLRHRVRRSIEVLEDESLTVRGSAACRVINTLLYPGTSSATRSLEFLTSVVTDRGSLLHMDNLICLLLAEELSGRRGARAFRDISPRILRDRWGLKSLYHVRNSGEGPYHGNL